MTTPTKEGERRNRNLWSCNKCGVYVGATNMADAMNLGNKVVMRNIGMPDLTCRECLKGYRMTKERIGLLKSQLL
jgi:hypothetical protein